MFPALTINDRLNSRGRYTELTPECCEPIWRSRLATPEAWFAARSLGSVPAPYLQNVGGRQFVPSSPLQDHISHVLGQRTNEEVPWIHARRVVAAMTDMHPIRYRAVIQRPDETMCEEGPIAATMPCPNDSIPAPDLRPRPNNAFTFCHSLTLTQYARYLS